MLSDKRYCISVLYRNARPPHLCANNHGSSPYRTRPEGQEGQGDTFWLLAKIKAVSQTPVNIIQRRGMGG
jgi:hypothetical protein